MRLTTLASAAVLALSTAALAQVGQAPTEQKLSPNSAMPDETVPEMNSANVASPAPAPGAPSTALVNSVADDPAAPVGQQPPK